MRDWADLTYRGKHKRIARVRGKADCCIVYLCSTGCSWFEWANISHRHLDVGDYMPMCRTHHEQYDGVSDEARTKMSESRTGLKHTDETRAKMSEALLGNQRGLGYKHTDATKTRISEANRIRVVSEETRAKMSVSAKARRTT